MSALSRKKQRFFISNSRYFKIYFAVCRPLKRTAMDLRLETLEGGCSVMY